MSQTGPDTTSLRDASPRQWRDVVIQSARDLWTANALEWAASLAFYAVLSLFPLLIVGMVIASYVVDVEWATDQAIDLLGRYLPEGGQTIEEIIEDALAQRRQVGLVSFAVLLLTGRRILGGLTKGLNLVSDVNVHDDTVKRRVEVELGLAVGLGGLVLVALASRRLRVLAGEAMERLPGPDSLQLAIAAGIVHVVLLLAIFTLVYAYVPRGERLWRAVFIGAIVATALFLLAQGVFTLLFDVLWRNLSLVYGPIAFAALLMTWSWYVSLVTLVGGAVASHVKVMVLERQPAPAAHARHIEGAA